MTRTLQWALALSLIAASAPAPAADATDSLDRLVRRFNRAAEAGDIERAERIAVRTARAFPDAAAAELMSCHLKAMGTKQATEGISSADLWKLLLEAKDDDLRVLALLELQMRRNDGYRPEAQLAAVREVWEELMRQERYQEAGQALEYCGGEAAVLHADAIRMMLLAQYKLKPKSSNPSAADELAALVAEYNELFQQRRYAEAEVLAKRAKELDPESPVAETMLWKAKFARHDARNRGNRDLRLAKEDCFCCPLPELDENGQIVDQPVQAPKSWDELTRMMRQSRAEATSPDRPRGDLSSVADSWNEWVERKRRESTQARPASLPREVSEAAPLPEPATAEPARVKRTSDIEQCLGRPYTLRADNCPLGEVARLLARTTGIPIVVDDIGLQEEGVMLDRPVSIELKDVRLRSVLNLLLGPMNLGWKVEDEVLKITSRRRTQGRLEVRTYPVADLVIPIPQAAPTANHSETPNRLTPPAARDGVAAPCEACRNTCARNTGVAVDAPGQPLDFDSLAELITTTVQPESWVENGGEASVRAFETTLSLVVRQTEQGHEEVRDLLEQLRRFHQVTMEFRFITVSDDFYVQPAVAESRRGVDSIQPVEHVELPGGVTTEHGQAVLAHEQCKRFVQAVQGDPRGNIMFAPKVTAFNGQRVEVASVTKPNPYTTAVDFALAARPVISQDRRTVSGVIQCEAGAATGEERTVEFRIKDGHTLLVDCGEVEDRARNQVQGAPVLSKVPYISRLFKNTGVHHTKRRLLLVTPRILVEEEEEELLGVPAR